MRPRTPCSPSLGAFAVAAVALVSVPAAAAPVEPQLPRGLVDIRMEPGPGAGTHDSASWITTRAPVFVPIPRMSASFVASESKTTVAITFSAEAATSAVGRRLAVRALVDGQVAAPADVVFTEGSFGGARSFTFLHEVEPGIHTVEMQWRTDPGTVARMRAASLSIRHGVRSGAAGTLTATAHDASDAETKDAVWRPIPGTSLGFSSPAGAAPTVVFSAATSVTTNKRLFVRALIDGAPLAPGDVVFAMRSTRDAHQMAFRSKPLAAGAHTVSLEWLVDAGGTARISDRSVVVAAFPENPQLVHRVIVPPSGPNIPLVPGAWAPVPGLSAVLSLPRNAEIAAGFSGEVHAAPGASMELRLVADGAAVDAERVVVASDGKPFATQSFTFDRKHLFTQESITSVWLEWRAVGGPVFIGDRALDLVVERGLIPDVAEAPAIGGNDPVEAAIGTRPLLTIIHEVERGPAHIPTVAEVTDAVHGSRGVNDYYDKVSGGRFGFTDAGVLSYPADETEDHYWDHDPFDCGAPAADGYAGGHVERWTEAILKADADVDFAAYDRDDDGTVSPQELSILYVVAQDDVDGYVRELWPYCDPDQPLIVDGVILPEIAEWLTSDPATSWEMAAHELAHLALGLGDLYANGWSFDTEVGELSLMGDNRHTTTHLDPIHKLALGWVTPGYATVPATYAVEDVKRSELVLVLPRALDGDGKESFVVETRYTWTDGTLYDERMDAAGAVVWHYVEDPAQSDEPPACMTPAQWANVTSNGRRAIRLLRPNIVFSSGLAADWDEEDYDLDDAGLVCPGAGVPANALLWADGTPSGWALRDFSAAGEIMTFDVETP
jgi:M6 family metalloprotease-like protein